MNRHNPLSDNIQYLKGIGEKRAKLFASLHIETIEDLLFFFPRKYEDWQTISDVATAPVDVNVCVKVRVLSNITAKGTHSGKTIYGTLARDDSGFLGLLFFNNKYVQYSIHDGDELYVYGKIRLTSNGGREMISPDFEKASSAPSLHAVYPQTTGLNSRQISAAVETALSQYGDCIEESLPDEQLKKYRLKNLRDSLRLIHFPTSQEDVAAARRRLIYEELLTLQLGLLRRGKGEKLSTGYRISADYTDEFCSLLPYSLTGAQKRAVAECISDMQSGSSMCRLLQGDVGSGKTAVAGALMYSAVKNGWQCALMAPTEILAVQHYNFFTKLFPEMTVTLLTGSLTASQKKKAKQSIVEGETDIVIGTHAVITDDTAFASLGLVITDEQHRFGVMQRASLRRKGNNPHVLVMSATPIPRTLSLIIFGDLDISVLDEKPAGRLPVKTYRVTSDYHERLYAFVKKEAAKGVRSYIVCPRVEEDESFSSSKQAAESYFRELSSGALRGIRTGLLHGKMKQKEKDAVMKAFASGELDVLVCTVVIEVGIDVPEAGIIIIENAESFGLSQLHQLRGRVGRGREQSHCILVSDSEGEDTVNRLSVMCATSDGFKIAEEDLKMRGPGDFFGSRQSGLPSLKLADLMSDSKILYAAKSEAENILASDPALSNPAYAILKQKTEKLFTDIS